ncbi:MAG: lipid-A-disaccharide synthase [bacterium]|nr:lipid-A-disaccharide synthase [bacterium]
MATVWVSAGDVSGDAIGADLIRAIAAARPGTRFVGLGGPGMEAAGLERFADQEALAIGGLLEWLPSLGRIVGIWRRVIRGLRASRPHLVIVIDSGGFHLPFMRVARVFCDAPILYYVAPQVWVWRAGRVRRIAARADRIAVVWPFEPAFWSAWGVETDFVGHPILDREVAQAPAPAARVAARSRLGLDPERPLVGLFPGSRRNELVRHLPPMIGALQRLRAERPDLDGVLVRAPSVDPERIDALLAEAGAGPEIRVVTAEPDWLDAIDVGLTKPGTITLELMLRERPMVVVGRAHALSVALVRRSFVGARVALPNLVAEEEIVPELLQDDATPDRIAAELGPLLPETSGASPSAVAQVGALRRARSRLGEPGASVRAARIAEEMLGADRA